MNSPLPLFQLNPALDRARLAEGFTRDRRLQVRDVLTQEAARTVQRILARETPWGFAWQAGDDGPHGLRHEQLSALSAAEREQVQHRIAAAMRGEAYAFAYMRYSLVEAYLAKWAEGGPHDLLLEHINSEPFLDLIRQITGDPALIKADAQATLYAPNQFLALHDDSQVAEGWRVAYVLNFALEEWRPEWGGYLLFYDESGDVVQGFKPRFNTLNLFQVPQKHSVSYVAPFAPLGRYAITGWFRDR